MIGLALQNTLANLVALRLTAIINVREVYIGTNLFLR